MRTKISFDSTKIKWLEIYTYICVYVRYFLYAGCVSTRLRKTETNCMRVTQICLCFSHFIFVLYSTQRANGYYLLTYARVFTYISKKIMFFFIFPHNAATIKYFTYALFVHNWMYGMHFTYRPMARPLRNVFASEFPKSSTYTHIKLLNFTPSRVSYHQIKSKATTHILFSFFFTIYPLHLIPSSKLLKVKKKSDCFSSSPYSVALFFTPKNEGELQWIEIRNAKCFSCQTIKNHKINIIDLCWVR